MKSLPIVFNVWFQKSDNKEFQCSGCGFSFTQKKQYRLILDADFNGYKNQPMIKASHTDIVLCEDCKKVMIGTDNE